MYIAITMFWFLVLLAFCGGVGYAFYYLLWKPSAAEKAKKAERLRRISDRQG